MRRLSLLAVICLFIIPSGVTAQESDGVRVGVVVQGSGGVPVSFCVTLSTPEPTGWDALQATGLNILADIGPMGTTVCKIGATGCAPPEQNCFCACMGGDSCAYWSYFQLGESGTWQYSDQGPATHHLVAGDVEGWWWRDSAATSDPLPPISFDEICGTTSGFPRTVVDGLGRVVTISASPQRIASVSLAADEMLLDLVGADRLLGVSLFASDPAISNIADRLEDIEYTNLIGNPEVLISLDADLVVLSTYNNPAAIDQLLDSNISVFVLSGFESLDDIRTNLRTLGSVTGTEMRAEELIADMDAALENVQRAVSELSPVRVLYYEPGGITYGPGSSVDEIITLAGGINVVAESDLGSYPLINPEYVIAADPDVILLGGWFSGETNPLQWIRQDPVLGSLRAVQTGHVYPITDAHLTAVSHYVVRGVEEVAALLYPDAFD